jgi:uncharacterized damage-inducible protein DinB
MTGELQAFVAIWEREAAKTNSLLESMPLDQYDFRPDPKGRSLGELAWHLAEVDAYTTFGIERGGFVFGMRPPGMERPKSIETLGPGYARMHADALERVSRLTETDLDRRIRHFTGHERTIRELLWEAVLLHMIHHRGQLSILIRLAGGMTPGIFGPNREEMAELMRVAVPRQ